MLMRSTSHAKGFLLIGLAALGLLLAACIPPPPPPPPPKASPEAGGAVAKGAGAAVAGDANAGRALFTSKGCVACHVAQGVPGAVGTIGPNLSGLGDAAKRPQLASGEPNTPANLRGWIKEPQTKKPGTMMPALGLSDKESDDLTVFLLTLK
jgi:cytochrome c2